MDGVMKSFWVIGARAEAIWNMRGLKARIRR